VHLSEIYGDLPDGYSPSDAADGFSGFAICDPCIGDDDCDDSICVALETGNFCVEECPTAKCDEGFVCTESGGKPLCLPEGGVCTCTAAQDGMEKACVKTSDFGQCAGTAVCHPDKGWECGATTPAEEACDNEDNDCDGKTDEDFIVGDWYFGPDDCGECGKSCADAIEHGTGYCSLVPPPECKVAACDPGFHSVDGVTCEVQQGSACVPCSVQEDCPGGSCLGVGTGLFCLPECLDGCPAGYECAPIPDGQLCFPVSGSCECTPESVGLTRSCETGNEFGKCVGMQACTVEGWGPCDAKVPEEETCNGLDDNCSGVADEDLSGVEPCVNSVPGVGSCPGYFECKGVLGPDCNAPDPLPEVCDYKDNQCDGVVDDPFVDPATGLYLGDHDCGVCGNDCTATTHPNADSVCQLLGPVPECGMQCHDMWVDLNGEPADGCECPFVSDDDPPDGVDQNCDGIDGDPDNAIFVSVVGNDLNPGTPELPVRTISKGVERCPETGKEHVYVASGLYSERVSLAEGVRIFGGFPPDFSKRDWKVNGTTIEGKISPDPAIPRAAVLGYGVGLGPKTSSFEGFTIVGPLVIEAGRSSYAIHLLDCGPQLLVKDNIMIAGQGGDGEDGDDGLDGIDGVPGAGGLKVLDAGTDQCNNLATKGGPGAQMSCGGVDVSGGAGGDAVCPDYNELGPDSACPVEEEQQPLAKEYGIGGFPAGTGGMGGEPGRDATQTVLFDGKFCNWDPLNCNYCHISLWGNEGHNGISGQAGKHGTGGAACSPVGGTVTAGEWTSIAGGSGAAGAPGVGGGGGGAGGGVETYGCFDVIGGDDLGASGGGGGSGGCSGSSGTPGKGAGGAFGIFVVFSNQAASGPSLQQNSVKTGLGGAGGSGGKGGVGGTGGWGGSGGASGAGDQWLWCAGEGGNGGNGGNGGSGGGGGGACGGNAVGVYVDVGHASPEYLAAVKGANSVTLEGSAGPGGAGGSSKGNPGVSGSIGLHQAYSY